MRAEGERPEVTPPHAGGRWQLVGTSFRPITAGGIGEMVFETNEFGYDFIFVPSRSGRTVLPAFVARGNDRMGRSKPLTIEVRAWPARRPAGFLGGVGPLTVATSARPEAVRVGEAFEFHVLLEGPGAIGSEAQPPDLARVRSLSIAPTVAVLPPEVVFDPPSRLLRYRVRPTKPGTVSLPAVAVAWLDPTSGRFQTSVAPAVKVRVVDVPRLDPAQLNYAPPPPPVASGSGWPLRGLGAACALGIMVFGAALFGRYHRSRSVSARRVARGFAWCFRKPLSTADFSARLVQQALARYLKAAAARPEGVLTPDEARRCFATLTGDAALADRVAELVRLGDRARYAHPDGDTQAAGRLCSMARQLFGELSRLSVTDPPAGSN